MKRKMKKRRKKYQKILHLYHPTNRRCEYLTKKKKEKRKKAINNHFGNMQNQVLEIIENCFSFMLSTF